MQGWMILLMLARFASATGSSPYPASQFDLSLVLSSGTGRDASCMEQADLTGTPYFAQASGHRILNCRLGRFPGRAGQPCLHRWFGSTPGFVHVLDIFCMAAEVPLNCFCRFIACRLRPCLLSRRDLYHTASVLPMAFQSWAPGAADRGHWGSSVSADSSAAFAPASGSWVGHVSPTLRINTD